MMRAVVLLGVGIAIGVAATGYWSPATAQVPARFTMVAGERVASSGIVLVKDSKSSGCWLLAQGGPGVALAPAPPEACK
jgi:hypothetical protein